MLSINTQEKENVKSVTVTGAAKAIILEAVTATATKITLSAPVIGIASCASIGKTCSIEESTYPYSLFVIYQIKFIL